MNEWWWSCVLGLKRCIELCVSCRQRPKRGMSTNRNKMALSGAIKIKQNLRWHSVHFFLRQYEHKYFVFIQICTSHSVLFNSIIIHTYITITIPQPRIQKHRRKVHWKNHKQMKNNPIHVYNFCSYTYLSFSYYRTEHKKNCFKCTTWAHLC